MPSQPPRKIIMALPLPEPDDMFDTPGLPHAWAGIPRSTLAAKPVADDADEIASPRESRRQYSDVTHYIVPSPTDLSPSALSEPSPNGYYYSLQDLWEVGENTSSEFWNSL
jgi:hypothetical protein